MISSKFNRLSDSTCHDYHAWRANVTNEHENDVASTALEIAVDVAEGNAREYYQTLLFGLARPGKAPQHPLQTLAFTSCHRGEGVSTVAAQLAVAAAGSDSQRVLLVDANIACPTLHTMFGVSAESDDQAPRRPSVQTTRYKNLGLLTAARLNDNDATSIFGSAESFSQLIVASKRSFDLTVFDMPAIIQTNPAMHLFEFFDGVVLVAEAERVRWEVAVRTKQRLTQAGANLLGVVLNKRNYHVPHWLYRTL